MAKDKVCSLNPTFYVLFMSQRLNTDHTNLTLIPSWFVVVELQCEEVQSHLWSVVDEYILGSCC